MLFSQYNFEIKLWLKFLNISWKICNEKIKYLLDRIPTNKLIRNRNNLQYFKTNLKFMPIFSHAQFAFIL